MISIKTIGFNKVSRSMGFAVGAIKKGMREGMADVGLHMQNEVKESIAGRKGEGPFTIIPRKVTKGGLIRGPSVKDSIDTSSFLQSVSFIAKFDQVDIFSRLKYAKQLEFGTSKTKPRKHFGNSLARNKSKIKDILVKDIKDELKSI